MSLLEVEKLKTYFYTRGGVVQAVDDVTYSMEKEEALGLAGESGCGKTTTALSIMRLVPSPGRIVSGQIFLDGKDVVPMDDEESNNLAKAAGLHGATIEIPGRVRCYLEEQDTPDHLWIRQFSNPGNEAGQSVIADELLEQTGGKIDVFIASIGTGGTFLGVTKVLKENIPNVKCIVVQPAGWDGWEDPLSPSKKYIPNISGGILEEIRDSGIADEIQFLGSDDARDMAYRLSREEGIFCGMSSGANVFVAHQEASKPGMKGKNIVTVLVDRGDRYLTNEKYTT